MAWTNTETAIGVGIGLLVAAGTVTITVKGIEALQTPAWQQHYDVSFVNRLPPQVKILPSLSSTLRSGLHVSGERDGKVIGLGQSVPDIVVGAYGVQPAQVIWKAPITGTRYNLEARFDVLANLPTNNYNAVKEVVRAKFGLTGRYETVETNALILAVKFTSAPGLRPASGEHSGNEQLNSYSAHGQGIDALVNYLESCSGIVIVNRTHLNEDYDIDFQWDGRTRDGLKQALLDQTGLELIPTNMTVQMLVVEQAK